MTRNAEKSSEEHMTLWRFASTFVGVLLGVILVIALAMSLRSIGMPPLLMRNIALDCLALSVCMLFYLSGLRNKENSREKQLFMCSIALTMLYLYLDEICWLINGRRGQRELELGANTGFYLISILLTWTFWHFAGSWKDVRSKIYESLGWVVNTVTIISVAIILYNVKGGFIFSVSENGVYRRADTYWISLIGPGIILALSALQILTRCIRLEDKLILLVYPVLPLIGSIMGVFVEGPTMLAIYVFLAVVFNYTNLYVRRIEEASITEGELTRSEVNAMMLQINPHFIYNTLGSAASLCDIDPGTAQELIYNFSDYLRDNFTDINSKPMIRFREEMEHLNHYIAIEKVRFPHIEVEYELQTQEFEIPTFTLQPLVENAIKHGICKRRKSEGTIWIQTLETESAYLVRVIDDGVGFSYVTASNSEGRHIGIQNVRTRLDILCGGTLNIDGEPGVGTTCEIRIPKKRV